MPTEFKLANYEEEKKQHASSGAAPPLDFFRIFFTANLPLLPTNFVLF